MEELSNFIESMSQPMTSTVDRPHCLSWLGNFWRCIFTSQVSSPCPLYNYSCIVLYFPNTRWRNNVQKFPSRKLLSELYFHLFLYLKWGQTRLSKCLTNTENENYGVTVCPIPSETRRNHLHDPMHASQAHEEYLNSEFYCLWQLEDWTIQ